MGLSNNPERICKASPTYCKLHDVKVAIIGILNAVRTRAYALKHVRPRVSSSIFNVQAKAHLTMLLQLCSPCRHLTSLILVMARRSRGRQFHKMTRISQELTSVQSSTLSSCAQILRQRSYIRSTVLHHTILGRLAARSFRAAVIGILLIVSQLDSYAAAEASPFSTRNGSASRPGNRPSNSQSNGTRSGGGSGGPGSGTPGNGGGRRLGTVDSIRGPECRSCG